MSLTTIISLEYEIIQRQINHLLSLFDYQGKPCSKKANKYVNYFFSEEQIILSGRMVIVTKQQEAIVESGLYNLETVHLYSSHHLRMYFWCFISVV